MNTPRFRIVVPSVSDDEAKRNQHAELMRERLASGESLRLKGSPKQTPEVIQRTRDGLAGKPPDGLLSQHAKDVLAQAKIPVTSAPKYNILETAKANLGSDIQKVAALRLGLRGMELGMRPFEVAGEAIGSVVNPIPKYDLPYLGESPSLKTRLGAMVTQFESRPGAEQTVLSLPFMAPSEPGAMLGQKVGQVTKSVIPVAKATLGRAIETGGVPAGIIPTKMTTAARAAKLSAESKPQRIARFTVPGLESQRVALDAQLEKAGFGMDAVAGLSPDEYFIVVQPPKFRGYGEDVTKPLIDMGASGEAVDKITKTLEQVAKSGEGTGFLYFQNMDDVSKFFTTGEYKAPSINFRVNPNAKPLYELGPQPKPVGTFPKTSPTHGKGPSPELMQKLTVQPEQPGQGSLVQWAKDIVKREDDYKNFVQTKIPRTHAYGSTQYTTRPSQPAASELDLAKGILARAEGKVTAPIKPKVVRVPKKLPTEMPVASPPLIAQNELATNYARESARVAEQARVDRLAKETAIKPVQVQPTLTRAEAQKIAKMTDAELATYNAARKPVAATKEPWQMTKAEWQAQPHFASQNALHNKYHSEIVAQSLSEGKPVPANVLAEYPDLAVAKPGGVPVSASLARRATRTKLGIRPSPRESLAAASVPTEGMRMSVPPEEILADMKKGLAEGRYHPDRVPGVQQNIAKLEADLAAAKPVQATRAVRPGEFNPPPRGPRQGRRSGGMITGVGQSEVTGARFPKAIVERDRIMGWAVRPQTEKGIELRYFKTFDEAQADLANQRLRNTGVSNVTLGNAELLPTAPKVAEAPVVGRTQAANGEQIAKQLTPAEVTGAGKVTTTLPDTLASEVRPPVRPSQQQAYADLQKSINAPPPIKPPVAKAVPPSGPNIPKYVEPTMMGKNVLGMKPIQAGLSKAEEIANIARRTVAKVKLQTVEANPLVSGAFKERARLKAVVDSQSGRLGTVNGTKLSRAFKLDKQGRITDLAGIDPTVPGAPTIQDVAARLPKYWDKLSAEQQAALIAARKDTTPFRSLLEEVGVEVPSRADVVEGGFYLPRGRADVEGADLPMKIGTGLGRGTKKGFEKPAVFDSQAAGIDAGYVYPPITDTLSAYARDAGTRAVDAHVTNFFKTATDETGLLIGDTPKMRLLEQNPKIAQQMEALRSESARLKGLTGRLGQKQDEALARFLDDPTYDDIDALRDALDEIVVTRGKSKGANLLEVNQSLNAVKAQVKALAIEYKPALRRAQQTSRLEGAVGLPGLQGWSFPDEIANAANIILRGEGAPTGLFSMPIRVANAFNNLYRGMRATLDNSAIGIQGLLGAADDPVAYAKAVGVNLKAWGPGGDAALGKYIGSFDDAATTAGRLTSDDWARATLRIGGAETEFQLGAGFSKSLARAPGIKQANRAFGYFGDALRLDWADDMLAAELRKGRTAQQLWDSGEVQKIAEIANNMTGYAQNKAFGSIGDLLLFAPRFLESRGETIVKGVAGLRPGASIEQRAARRSLLKMIGYGAALTVAANEMLGNETDFRPLIKTKYGWGWNPNFMRVRFAGRDWSIYGTWDSFARAFTLTAMGKPLDALRGLGSGVVADAWDIIGNRDFDGNKVRDNPARFAKWALESMLPFSTQSLPSTVKAGVEAVQSGDVSKIAGSALSMGLQVQGAKSSPITLRERIGFTPEEEMAYDAIPTKGFSSNVAKKLAAAQQVYYLKTHPDVEAKRFITGQSSSFIEDENGAMPGMAAAVKLMKENGIGIKDIPSLAVKLDESLEKKKFRAQFVSALRSQPQKTQPSPTSTPKRFRLREPVGAR